MIPRLPLLSLGLLLAACATPQRRIEANPERFASYPPEIQQAIREGRVQPGFTPDMVEMALGEPRRVYSRTQADAQTEVWQYVYLRSHTTSQPVHVGGGRAGGTVWVDSENTYEIPFLRVEFQNGTVYAIEELEE